MRIRALMGQQQVELPSGYDRVNYLQSQGGQRIDTCVGISQDIKLRMVFEEIDAWDKALFGVGTYARNAFMLTGHARSMIWFGTGIKIPLAAGIVKNTVIATKTSVTINGVENECTDSKKSGNIQLFGMTNGYHSKYKLYEIQISKSDVEVFNGVPCIRKSDGVYGLYDTVSRAFFGNIDTGEFIGG